LRGSTTSPRVAELDIQAAGVRGTLGAYTGTTVVGGNRVEILLNGEEIFPATIALIRARVAHQLRPVRLRGRRALQESRPALANVARTGIKVNVLLDAVGALAMPAELREEMQRRGCKVESFRPLSPFSVDRRELSQPIAASSWWTGLVGVTRRLGISGKVERDTAPGGHCRTPMSGSKGRGSSAAGCVRRKLAGGDGRRDRRADTSAQRLESKGCVRPQCPSSQRGGSTAMYTMFLLLSPRRGTPFHITNPTSCPMTR